MLDIRFHATNFAAKSIATHWPLAFACGFVLACGGDVKSGEEDSDDGGSSNEQDDGGEDDDGTNDDDGNEQTSGGEDSNSEATDSTDNGSDTQTDADEDDDGVPNDEDNCPAVANPDQLDGDNDGAGDACDECPDDPDQTQVGDCGCGEVETDADLDGVADCIDNCPDIPNADQEDLNEDGKGDGCACDPQPQKCVDGMAGQWPCKGLDLVANLAPKDMDLDMLNTNWGWVDPETGYEYALVAGYEGVAFVDMHHPYCPRHLGVMPKMTENSIWRDVKIFKTFAYSISEDDGGLQIFDLAQLRGVESAKTWEPTNSLKFGRSHTVAVNTDTGHLFVVMGEVCKGGIEIWDLNENLAEPKKVGCWDEKKVHEIQCAVYHGPDVEYRDTEICIASTDKSGDITIIDLSDPSNPKTISSDPYPDAVYSHQGWMTEDHHYYVHGDELDEQENGHPTRTHIWDFSDLDKLKHLGYHEAPTKATDHNMYIHNGLLYQANYRAGLRVLDLKNIGEGKLEEVAFFDTYPQDDESNMSSAWSNYPFHPSGNIIVTALNEGLFIVRHSQPAQPAQPTQPAQPAR